MPRLLAAFLVSAVLVAATPVAPATCVALSRPVDGPVVAPFAPVGRYGGHWGVDFAADPGTSVRAAGAGTVSFSGSVAGMHAVTVDHGGGLKTTVSSVADRLVFTGSSVVAGRPIAVSGAHDGADAVHVSVRIDGRYVDPMPFFSCLATAPVGAVRLVPLP